MVALNSLPSPTVFLAEMVTAARARLELVGEAAGGQLCAGLQTQQGKGPRTGLACPQPVTDQSRDGVGHACREPFRKGGRRGFGELVNIHVHPHATPVEGC